MKLFCVLILIYIAPLFQEYSSTIQHKYFFEVMCAQQNFTFSVLQARFEILSSEASYFKSLTILVSLFYKSPVFTPTAPNAVISALDKHELFSNIIDITNTSEKWAQFSPKLTGWVAFSASEAPTNTLALELCLRCEDACRLSRLCLRNTHMLLTFIIK